MAKNRLAPSNLAKGTRCRIPKKYLKAAPAVHFSTGVLTHCGSPSPNFDSDFGKVTCFFCKPHVRYKFR